MPERATAGSEEASASRQVGFLELRDAAGPIPTFPPRAFDEQGRLIPISPEEREARAAAAIRAIDVIANITDENDDDESWREILRDLDAHRPHRPLFEGMY